ncbi:MAG: hypothetical protein JW941_10610 [Candidatus Coatesbacteria bacterium]|nr:hypothetical protein [Candidatus Coatesbacteria bacterium]
MSKKSLIVLSASLLIVAGIAVYVFANGCCGEGEDALCSGSVSSLGDCNFYFSVYHDRDSGGGTHTVDLLIKKDGDLDFATYMMTSPENPPLPVCVLYQKALTLQANSTYYYHFECRDCSGRDPDAGSGDHTLFTGQCN